MNIFYLDQNPYMAAEYHSDKHCVKMILETAQILMTNYHKFQGYDKKKEFTEDYIMNHFAEFPRQEDGIPKPYGMTHINHPSTIWARSSIGNFMYTLRLGQHLCVVYESRYKKQHACGPIFKWIEDRIANIMRHLGEWDITTPALAMPKELHNENYVNQLLKSVNTAVTKSKSVNAYRAYYIFYKKDINVWAHSDKPLWHPSIELINEKIEKNGNRELINN